MKKIGTKGLTGLPELISFIPAILTVFLFFLLGGTIYAATMGGGSPEDDAALNSFNRINAAVREVLDYTESDTTIYSETSEMLNLGENFMIVGFNVEDWGVLYLNNYFYAGNNYLHRPNECPAGSACLCLFKAKDMDDVAGTTRGDVKIGREPFDKIWCETYSSEVFFYAPSERFFHDWQAGHPNSIYTFNVAASFSDIKEHPEPYFNFAPLLGSSYVVAPKAFTSYKSSFLTSSNYAPVYYSSIPETAMFGDFFHLSLNMHVSSVSTKKSSAISSYKKLVFIAPQDFTFVYAKENNPTEYHVKPGEPYPQWFKVGKLLDTGILGEPTVVDNAMIFRNPYVVFREYYFDYLIPKKGSDFGSYILLHNPSSKPEKVLEQFFEYASWVDNSDITSKTDEERKNVRDSKMVKLGTPALKHVRDAVSVLRKQCLEMGGSESCDSVYYRSLDCDFEKMSGYTGKCLLNAYASYGDTFVQSAKPLFSYDPVVLEADLKRWIIYSHADPVLEQLLETLAQLESKGSYEEAYATFKEYLLKTYAAKRDPSDPVTPTASDIPEKLGRFSKAYDLEQFLDDAIITVTQYVPDSRYSIDPFYEINLESDSRKMTLLMSVPEDSLGSIPGFLSSTFVIYDEKVSIFNSPTNTLSSSAKNDLLYSDNRVFEFDTVESYLLWHQYAYIVASKNPRLKSAIGGISSITPTTIPYNPSDSSIASSSQPLPNNPEVDTADDEVATTIPSVAVSSSTPIVP